MKICRRCNRKLSEENFYKVKKNNDGLHSYCIECCKEKARIWEKENYDKHVEGVKRYQNKDKDEWKKSNKIAVDKYRENGGFSNWQSNNKDKLSDYQIKRRMNKTHKISEDEWNKCLNYFDNSCAYCGLPQEESIKKYGQVLHKEHVDHNGANDLSNNVPSCKGCNSSKGTFKFEFWYDERNEVYSQIRKQKILNWINSDYLGKD